MKCNLCNSKNIKFLFENKDKFYRNEGTFKLYQCENCGLIFINPQPSEKELSKYYPSEEYYSFREEKSPEGGLYERLNINPKKNLTFLFLKPLKKFLRTTKIIPGGRILDIGCGDGGFLRLMKKTGMECYGLEPGKAPKIKGIKFFNGPLEKAKYPSNFFDVVTLNHVFEHVPDPSSTIKEIHRILKKGGTAIIAVPQSKSFAFKMFRKNWVNLDTPRHLFIYSPKTLKRYAKKSGFEIEKLNYKSSPLQFLGSYAYWTNKWRSKKIFLSDKSFIHDKKLFFLFLPLVALIDFIRQGDAIEIILRKK